MTQMSVTPHFGSAPMTAGTRFGRQLKESDSEFTAIKDAVKSKQLDATPKADLSFVQTRKVTEGKDTFSEKVSGFLEQAYQLVVDAVHAVGLVITETFKNGFSKEKPPIDLFFYLPNAVYPLSWDWKSAPAEKGKDASSTHQIKIFQPTEGKNDTLVWVRLGKTSEEAKTETKA